MSAQTALNLSLVANLLLVAVAAWQNFKFRKAIVSEKLSTFGGCIAAISLGLLREEHPRQIDAIVEGIHRLQPNMNHEDIKFHLVRSSALRLLRNDIAFDVLGEKMNVESYKIYPKLMNTKVADYVQDNPDEPDLGKRFGDEALF